MVLRFIYGRSGSGKTYLCLREIEKRLKENCTHPLVLLVPEQYTFQAEKELIRVLESGGILKVEVLSFRRLAFRVFNEAGGLTSPHLHPAGKCMLIAKALFKLKPELNMFAKAADHQGFLSEISALITEFKRYNIDPSKLLRVADSWRENDLLRTKISEIAAIYQEYDNLLSEKYSDTDDDLSRAALKIQEIDLYQGAEIWVDGFSGFTPQEYLLLAELFSQAQKVNICLDTDSLDQTELLEGTDTFETVKKTHYRLCQIAAEKGLEIEYHRINVGSASSALPRFKNSIELSHLEKNFYTYPPEIYKEETEDINIFSALNPFTEIEAVARKVLKLCRERGWRYRDIAVLTGDLENYGRLIEVIFAEYEIPYFLDRKLEITQHPLIRLVLSIFAIFKENWSYEAVFSYLKTGLTALPQEDIDRLENYVLASGIKGKRWTNDEDWKMDPGFSSRSPGKEQDEELRRINRLRLEITEPLLKFRHKTKGRRTANEICSALVELLETLEVPAQIERQIDTYKQEGQLYLAQGNAQIWNILMEVFDQVCEIMKEEKMGIEKFASILSSGLNEYKIGFIPISLEQVLVGNIDRSRSPEVKALFILGVNEGTFPANTLDEGILSDADRAKLQLAGVELSGDTKTKAFEEQYLVYRVLAIPSRYLHLSWSIADQEGKSRRPSLVLSRLRKIFPKVSEQSNILPPVELREELENVAGRWATFRQLPVQIRQKSKDKELGPVWREVYRWFSSQADWKEHCKTLDSAFHYKNIAEPLGREKISSLYGSPMQLSISKLESYTTCSFAFFLEYGLRAKKRRLFQLTPPDIGTFIHEVIERFSREVATKNLSWRELDFEWCQEKTFALVEEMLSEMKSSNWGSSQRIIASMARLKRVITRAVWLISEHIRRSGFEPLGYELVFGGGEEGLPPIVLELENGERIHLKGRIDRVDALETEEGTYLRIIDYKSGAKDFNLSDVYYGLQLQLITYLDVLSEHNPLNLQQPILPGGVLYFRVQDPIIRNKRKASEEEIELAIMKELKMKGLLLADLKLIKEMDREIEGSSLIIPARINKGDVLGKSSAVASLEQFADLKRYVNSLLKQLAAEILGGAVPINPYRKKDFTPCEYCNFGAVCQFDTGLKENTFRLMPELKEEDVWTALESNTEEGNGD